jgi:signal transduction histidine kinase
VRIARRGRTLRGRVSALALIVIAGWLVLLATGFDLVLSSRLDQQVDDALRIRAQAASATLQLGNGTIAGVRESATDRELDGSIWVFAGTRSLERPDVPASIQRIATGLADHPAGYAAGGNRRFYVLPLRDDAGRRIGSVIASINTTPYDETKRTAMLGSIVVAVLLLGGAYPVLRLTAARALRPVAQMTRQAADWSVAAPTQRFGEHQQYQELSSLASTLDSLLDRLAAVLRHERQLSAELSHELRTPLARVMAEVDLMLDTAAPDQRAPLEALRAGCASMDAIIDTLLAAARTELVRTVGRCDLDPVLASFADETARPAVIAVRTGLSVGVDADVVKRILAPIVGNGRRYATAEVRLTARRAGSAIAVAVDNDGSRLAPGLAEQVFEPGFTTSTLDGHDGAGLGLALARRLARAADGDLFVDDAAPATTFVLTLPAG